MFENARFAKLGQGRMGGFRFLYQVFLGKKAACLGENFYYLFLSFGLGRTFTGAYLNQSLGLHLAAAICKDFNQPLVFETVYLFVENSLARSGQF